eukprot:356684-Chlamydomonas_euryale.AAC.2
MCFCIAWPAGSGRAPVSCLPTPQLSSELLRAPPPHLSQLLPCLLLARTPAELGATACPSSPPLPIAPLSLACPHPSWARRYCVPLLPTSPNCSPASCLPAPQLGSVLLRATPPHLSQLLPCLLLAHTPAGLGTAALLGARPECPLPPCSTNPPGCDRTPAGLGTDVKHLHRHVGCAHDHSRKL